jgi:hypothetical protein
VGGSADEGTGAVPGKLVQYDPKEQSCLTVHHALFSEHASERAQHTASPSAVNPAQQPVKVTSW